MLFRRIRSGLIPASFFPSQGRERYDLRQTETMKLKHWIRFLWNRDTTWQGQFAALRPLLLGRPGIQPFVVDVGANDGFFASNSYPFIARGWGALLVEPHPDAFHEARRRHRGRRGVTLVQGACSTVAGQLPLLIGQNDQGGSHSHLGDDPKSGHEEGAEARTVVLVAVHRLESLLEAHGVPCEFGLLSIDTEGHDLQVIQGANLARFRPQVIITETNDDESIKSEYLRSHGYELHARLECDTIWKVSSFSSVRVCPSA